MTTRRRLAAAAATCAVALTLGACSAGDDGSGGDEISIAVVPGWDDGVAVSELWSAVLTEQGYDVSLESVDIATTFVGLAGGDYDLYLGSWLPVTHASYLDQFGDQIEKVGVWNAEARNQIAVNADAPIDSLDELAEHADEFDGRLIGIEAGAGLTQLTEQNVIPDYGLEDLEYLTSSTPAMLSELDGALSSGQNIAVTLWQPHWAYDVYDLKNLEDPEGSLGEAEEITMFSREGFADDQSEVQGWLSDFTMDMDLFSSLQSALFLDNETDEYDERLAEWMAENQDWVDALTA